MTGAGTGNERGAIVVVGFGQPVEAARASFALLEVVFAVLFAWAVVDQLPSLPQVLGGVLIVAVRLGDRQIT